MVVASASQQARMMMFGLRECWRSFASGSRTRGTPRMRLSWVLVVSFGWVGVAGAVDADWTTAVFPDRSHNFGTVARGSKVRHSFPVVNSTNQIIHIKGYQTKCGCTDVRLGAKDVPPGTQTTVEAVLDTTNFQGYKPSGLTLKLDRPVEVDIDLNLTCFIQSDLTLAPGQVDFGIINRSAGSQAELNLTYSGAQPNWAISSAFTVSDHVTATLQEQGRSAGGPLVYRLAVKLKPSVPVGFFKDEITLKTNDPNTPAIPISVAAVVQSNVVATPSVINLGAVRAGESIQRTFVVRSSQPFKVVSAESKQSEISVGAAPDQAKPLHAMSFTFKAPTNPGSFNSAIEVLTDLKDEPATKLMVFATITP